MRTPLPSPHHSELELKRTTTTKRKLLLQTDTILKMNNRLGLDDTLNMWYPPPRALMASATAMNYATAFATPVWPMSFGPPPMRSHYYCSMIQSATLGADGTSVQFLPSTLPTFSSMHQYHHTRPTTSVICSASNSGISSSELDEMNNTNEADTSVTDLYQKRIAIIGGGIAGVTAANALGKKLSNTRFDAKIVVFEGDESGHKGVNFGEYEQPTWIAATARNANSMVPGAAMHVMSQRSTLLKVIKDTVREFWSEKIEDVQHWLRSTHRVDYQRAIDNFSIVPPYFAFHLFKCMGPSATWDERATFVTFLKNFLMVSVLSGEVEAKERGRVLQQLARSNRFSFLEAINGGNGGKALAEKIGVGKGFLSLHRTSESAIHAFEEGKLFGETCRIMPFKEAIAFEPRVANLPIGTDLFAVHRIDDYTANSAVFVQDLIEKIGGRGAEYRCGNTGAVVDLSRRDDQRFQITTKDGSSHDFDFVVLAAGVNTPLFARKLSLGESCPTYPLRGYSLTIYTNHTCEGRDKQIGKKPNLLKMPLSIDDIYCSSVGTNMARMAGFGELVGYRERAVDVPSLAPRVITRYAKSIFPESDVTEDHALQCFRPMSPDDIPIVGKAAPGVYIHTGHGTLGWTLCLATSECLAQALSDDINGSEANKKYQLPGNISVDRERLSPNRFR